MRADGRTDRRTETAMTTVIFRFRNFPKAPKNNTGLRYSLSYICKVMLLYSVVCYPVRAVHIFD
jgi:hypothetical protein